jgi:rubredoxin
MTTNNDHEPNGRDRVAPGMACPRCGEDEMDSLVWIDDDQVRCTSCGTVYDPNQPDAKA